jgi:hypothetical protein
MATRSMIGKQQEDGTIKAIYCHYDGYPEGVGQTLADYYQTSDKVDELLNLGDLSVLRQEIGEKQDFNKPTNEDWSLAYGRDRGEEGTEAKDFIYPGAYLEYARNSCAEFAYIFTPKGWAYWNLRTDEPTRLRSSSDQHHMQNA